MFDLNRQIPGRVLAWLVPPFSGGLLVLSFPEHDLDRLAWFALVPLLVALPGAPEPR